MYWYIYSIRKYEYKKYKENMYVYNIYIYILLYLFIYLDEFDDISTTSNVLCFGRTGKTQPQTLIHLLVRKSRFLRHRNQGHLVILLL